MTHSRSRILALLDEHDLRPSRALGQNYVADANTVRRIVRLAGVSAGDRVVEIGAGLGSLTLALAEAGAEVTAIEIDKRTLPVLRGVVEPKGVAVVEGDATTIDWSRIVPASERATVIANLPYNVGTSIFARILEEAPQIDHLVVMVQKEVAERFVASPGSKAYGALSVKVRFHGAARMIGVVPPTVFVPQPEVDSALVDFRRAGATRGDVDEEALFALVRAGFAQRRKMLRRSLAGLVDPEAFAVAGIAETARAEELDVDDWARLAIAAAARGGS